MRKIIAYSIIVVLLGSAIFVPQYVYAYIEKSELQNKMIFMTKELINEFYYYENVTVDEQDKKICYDLYLDDNTYYVVLFEYNIVYSFLEYEKRLYYINYNDFTNAEKIDSGVFYIDDIHIPLYDMNDMQGITYDFDYDIVCSNIINNIRDTESSYTLHLLNDFTWNKAEYPNNMRYRVLKILIEYDDGRVIYTHAIPTYCGWSVVTMGEKIIFKEEYPELVKKYKDTSVYCKTNVIG